MESIDNNQIRKNNDFLKLVVGFGLSAFLVKWFDLHLPTTIESVQNDPREIFVLLGAALAGPLGGGIIGFLSGLPLLINKEIIGVYSIIGHLIGGVLVGYIYKKWRVEDKGTLNLLIWWLLVVGIYYSLGLVLFFVASIIIFSPETIVVMFGSPLSFLEAYKTILSIAFNELPMTYVITVLILVILPNKYRKQIA